MAAEVDRDRLGHVELVGGGNVLQQNQRIPVSRIRQRHGDFAGRAGAGAGIEILRAAVGIQKLDALPCRDLIAIRRFLDTGPLLGCKDAALYLIVAEIGVIVAVEAARADLQRVRRLAVVDVEGERRSAFVVLVIALGNVLVRTACNRQHGRTVVIRADIDRRFLIGLVDKGAALHRDAAGARPDGNAVGAGVVRDIDRAVARNRYRTAAAVDDADTRRITGYACGRRSRRVVTDDQRFCIEIDIYVAVGDHDTVRQRFCRRADIGQQLQRIAALECGERLGRGCIARYDAIRARDCCNRRKFGLCDRIGAVRLFLAGIDGFIHIACKRNDIDIRKRAAGDAVLRCGNLAGETAAGDRQRRQGCCGKCLRTADNAVAADGPRAGRRNVDGGDVGLRRAAVCLGDAAGHRKYGVLAADSDGIVAALGIGIDLAAGHAEGAALADIDSVARLCHALGGNGAARNGQLTADNRDHTTGSPGIGRADLAGADRVGQRQFAVDQQKRLVFALVVPLQRMAGEIQRKFRACGNRQRGCHARHIRLQRHFDGCRLKHRRSLRNLVDCILQVLCRILFDDAVFIAFHAIRDGNGIGLSVRRKRRQRKRSQQHTEREHDRQKLVCLHCLISF